MTSVLVSDLQNTVDWSRKWLVDFKSRKIKLVSFDQSNNTGAIDIKKDGSVLKEKSPFKIIRLNFSSKLDWGSNIISTVKTASKKIGALIYSISFIFLRLLCIFINLPYSYA